MGILFSELSLAFHVFSIIGCGSGTGGGRHSSHRSAPYFGSIRLASL